MSIDLKKSSCFRSMVCGWAGSCGRLQLSTGIDVQGVRLNLYIDYALIEGWGGGQGCSQGGFQVARTPPPPTKKLYIGLIG